MTTRGKIILVSIGVMAVAIAYGIIFPKEPDFREWVGHWDFGSSGIRITVNKDGSGYSSNLGQGSVELTSKNGANLLLHLASLDCYYKVYQLSDGLSSWHLLSPSLRQDGCPGSAHIHLASSADPTSTTPEPMPGVKDLVGTWVSETNADVIKIAENSSGYTTLVGDIKLRKADGYGANITLWGDLLNFEGSQCDFRVYRLVGDRLSWRLVSKAARFPCPADGIYDLAAKIEKK